MIPKDVRVRRASANGEQPITPAAGGYQSAEFPKREYGESRRGDSFAEEAVSRGAGAATKRRGRRRLRRTCASVQSGDRRDATGRDSQAESLVDGSLEDDCHESLGFAYKVFTCHLDAFLEQLQLRGSRLRRLWTPTRSLFSLSRGQDRQDASTRADRGECTSVNATVYERARCVYECVRYVYSYVHTTIYKNARVYARIYECIHECSRVYASEC